MALALLSSTPIRDQSKFTDSEMIFWNIGQGDFMTLVTPQGCWAFDVGGNITIPLKNLVYIKENCPGRRLELFVSHFDKDHIRNFSRLASHIIVIKATFSHLLPRSAFGKKLLENLKFQSAEIQEIRAGFTAKMGDFRLFCLWPPPLKTLGKAENDRSLVLLLKGHGKTFLLTGDLPGKLENKFITGDVDILKVAHHGSRSSTTDKFLARLKSKACVVSVGAHNTYGHPTIETLRRLAAARCTIIRTDRLGDIFFKL